MMLEIKWHDTDPETGQRRFLCAERFAGVWRFRWKLMRRGPWNRWLEPTRAMWEHVLDSLKRRYRRREGVEEEDIKQAEKLLKEVIRREEVMNAPDEPPPTSAGPKGRDDDTPAAGSAAPR